MQLNDYVPLAVRTESKIENVVFDTMQFHQLMTMSIRMTELMDMMKKNVFYGKPLDAIKWRSALTDVMLAAQNVSRADINKTPAPILKLDTRLFHSAIGIFTEAGEMFSALWNMGSPEDVDVVNFREELGDVEWYQAIAYDALGANAEDNLQNNIDKLTARYPDKFDANRAINRNLDTEREILEKVLYHETAEFVREALKPEDPLPPYDMTGKTAFWRK